MNIKLLKKVRKLIAEEPQRLDMGVWGEKNNPRNEHKPPCGTVACLAGWTVLAATPKRKWKELFNEPTGNIEFLWFGRDVAYKAAKLLGIEIRNEFDAPFGRTSWKVADVLAWIDEQIAGAKP